MKTKKMVVILGMHRSGTSLITSSLRVFGIELGDNILPPADDNPKGFWEDTDINKLNIRMLREINKDWHHLAPINSRDIALLKQKGYLSEAQTVLTKKLAEVNLFGFKDPRVSKLLPFWKLVFEQIEIHIDYIVCIRNPLSIAKSLAKRNSIHQVQSYFLWLGHLLESLKNTTNKQRIVIDYDLFVQSPVDQLNRISKKIGLSPVESELDRFLSTQMDKDLRHSLFDIHDLKSDRSCPSICINLYSNLLQLASNSQADDETFAAKVLLWSKEFARMEILSNYTDKLVEEKTKLNKKLTSLNTKLDETSYILSKAVEVSEARDLHITALESKLIDSNFEIAEFHEKTTLSLVHIESLAAEIVEKNKELDSGYAINQVHEQRIKTYEFTIANSKEKIIDISGRLKEWHSIALAKDKQIASLETERSDMQNHIENIQRDLKISQATTKSSVNLVATLESNATEANKEQEETTASLNNALAFLNTNTTHINSIELELDQLKNSLAFKVNSLKKQKIIVAESKTDLLEFEKLVSENRIYQDKNSCYESQLADIYSSSSWILTSPLRRVKQLFSKLFQFIYSPTETRQYQNLDFDAYQLANPDIREAVHKGVFASPRTHFLELGIDEVRSGFRKINKNLQFYDELQYLAANPDVQEAISSGKYSDGFDHFLKHGLKEVLDGTRLMNL